MRLVHVRNHQKKAKEGGQPLIPIAKSVIDNLITVSVPVGGPYLLQESIVLVEAAFFREHIFGGLRCENSNDP